MKIKQTRKHLNDLVTTGIVPGISYAILDNNQVQLEVRGNSQIIPRQRPLRYGMLYDVASLTKVVGTTTLVLKLRNEGKLTLQDPISNYLPLFKDSRVTIQHLLTHTSAISGYIPHRNELPPQQLLTALDQLPVQEWIGKKVVYTDVGLIMLGQIIEYFYHQPVQHVITNEVLKPLGLTESTFTPLKDQCVPTELNSKRGLIQGEVHDPKAYILKEHCGSAGLFMSLNDLVKFAQWILIKNKHRKVLNEATIQSLFHDWTPTGKLQRSLGWDLRYSPDKTPWIYHTGYTGTFILLSKQRDQGLIVLTNRIHPSTNNKVFLDQREKIVTEFIA